MLIALFGPCKDCAACRAMHLRTCAMHLCTMHCSCRPLPWMRHACKCCCPTFCARSPLLHVARLSQLGHRGYCGVWCFSYTVGSCINSPCTPTQAWPVLVGREAEVVGAPVIWASLKNNAPGRSLNAFTGLCLSCAGCRPNNSYYALPGRVFIGGHGPAPAVQCATRGESGAARFYVPWRLWEVLQLGGEWVEI